MECREFSEISEAYLSDELLVETNIRVFRHLENCPKCCEQFAARRALRQQIRASVLQAPEFQIDPAFANRVTADLKEAALFKSPWRRLFAPMVLIPLFAGILIVAFLGLVLTNPSVKRALGLLPDKPLIAGVVQLFKEVAGHHRTCAIEKLKLWEQQTYRDPAKEAIYVETVVKPLQQNLSDRIKLLHVDDCVFEGKPFVHVILKDGDNVVSVFFAKSDLFPADTTDADSILTEKESGFQIAAFQKNTQAVFVVSGLSETENLSFARTLLDAWKQA